ncbi:hypothetical protein A5821_002380 [Enterococcus sp. 7F3_DIV0205]|uniref:LXG domain-containing protein n=1 Tax=Candidatus Enterococcus palustris TaxID=1834189 RepID=A0AAQ3W9K7_9ENTE|nr:T7SS effector LXG polymorphic toxin [Enterococcus sp. 7F3_DIV0205]OTN82811.1 hypothetical protein A5821_002734 [Enterococcus sp. 7F3_DIV0205]
MGLSFYIGEVQAQANQASRMNNQASQAIASLQTSIQSFLSAPLSSKAYDSAKSYFMVAYTPLCQSAIMTGEALESANKRLLSDYQSMVCGIDTIEDEILEQIARFEEVKRDVEQQMSTAKTTRPDLERRYMNACETIEKRREKLRKFHEYNTHSASIFSDYEASEAEFSTGLNQVANCKAWNPATGTFDMTRLNMSWAKPINERWKARAKEIENRAKAKRDNWERQVKADGLKLQGELDIRKYMLVDINGTKRWMWVIDPNRITQEDFRVNEAYDLWIKNQIELYGRDAVLGKEEPDYLTKLAIELRDGKNYDTGKPLTDLEKAQRWATIASMIAATGIAGYYANNPLTAGQVTPKRTPITGSKDGKNYALDRNKSKGNWDVKTPSGINPRTVIKNGGKMPNHIVIQKGGLSKDGKPNSSADILNPDGSVKQRRYYDEKGRATEDIDFNHSDDGTHEFPHRHKWDWSNPEKPKRLK